jgi:hypothetical protein
MEGCHDKVSPMSIEIETGEFLMVLSITISLFNRILIAPYENRDGWELNVMFVNGTLYLEEHATEERLAER